ncbi:putative serine esterase-domain-containing protein [Aspergillus pseudonomiae]|uniref:Putative serine esterase-domain-containing protein n=1 Tax=Aspergillus pseudonomiae TaxID=1506151 RepID=A0A5N6IIX1_9EURO|nr:putative serine esterase-domain-containing protein [Aspergillus pseudonomiae]KAB8266345.1 putative serine esterase-domain-containing protein [Aspergillus pseudonomiae]KAE8404500.1 putative serine esterase-domain-containing protein [Aspergillus pseudonomiae]
MGPSNHQGDESGIPRKADHLCVLIHGFWGNPSHMDHLAASLRQRYSEDRLHVLVAERNIGNLTYDGIEVGGERVAHEIEETLGTLADQGCPIRKLSVVGYSFGGLLARYAIGLLDARGWFDKLEPVNFTTFVSPHVGVRIPRQGVWGYIWNNVGPRQGSISAQQLFLVDSFGDSGRPLLSILADPDSIFVWALAKFKNRSLYGNVVNDRTTIFYTTTLSLVDPFRDLGDAQVNYVKGYEPVVIDPDMYFLPSAEVKESLPLASRVWEQITRFFTTALFWVFIALFLSIVLPLFFLHSISQWSHSRERVRLHEEGESATLFRQYRLPHVMVKQMQSAIEEAYEDVGFSQDPEYLSTTSNSSSADSIRRRNSPSLKAKEAAGHKPSSITIQEASPPTPEHGQPNSTRETTADDAISKKGRTYPTLALTPAQLSIIESLNSVGFRKYPVYIHNHRHTHAAIIVRAPKPGFDEGKVVIKHWLDTEFQI